MDNKSEEDQSSNTSELDHHPSLQIHQSLQGQDSTGAVIAVTSGHSKSGSNSNEKGSHDKKGLIIASNNTSKSPTMSHNSAGSSPTARESDSNSAQHNFNKLTNTHSTERHLTGISVIPFGTSKDSGMSSSSSEDSINEFTRGGSYVLKKVYMFI